jgi:hypothetical protein
MKKSLIISFVALIVIGFFLIDSKNKAEKVAQPIMEQCWESDSIKIISLTMRPSLREGFNWRAGVRYTENGSPEIFENNEYGYVPEILINIFTSEVKWKHFEEIGDSSPGCEPF